MQYTVTATIQSHNIDGNAPVDVQWYSGSSLAAAVVAMGQAAVHSDDTEGFDLPDSVRYRTLSVRLDTVYPKTCTYCREVPADTGFDRCLTCRTRRDDEDAVYPEPPKTPEPREGETWWVVDQIGATHVWPTADAAEEFFTTEFQGGSTNLRLGFIMVPHDMSADEMADYACSNGFTVVASANVAHTPDCDLIVYRDGVHTCDCK